VRRTSSRRARADASSVPGAAPSAGKMSTEQSAGRRRSPQLRRCPGADRGKPPSLRFGGRAPRWPNNAGVAEDLVGGFSWKFSRWSCFSCWGSSVVRPGRLPVSRSAGGPTAEALPPCIRICRRRIESSAHCEECSWRWSKTIGPRVHAVPGSTCWAGEPSSLGKSPPLTWVRFRREQAGLAVRQAGRRRRSCRRRPRSQCSVDLPGRRQCV
jgi:hypothetical protein